MSYIPDVNTREEYLASKSAINTRRMAETSLTQFGRFTESEYGKTSEEIIADLKDDGKALEKIYTVLNKWITWLGQDHPEIITYRGRYKNIKKTFKAIHPNTQKQYLNHIKGFLEDVGGFDINNRRLRKRVRLPKAEEEEPEPLTKEELRILLDNCTNKKKTMLMVIPNIRDNIKLQLQIRRTITETRSKRLEHLLRGPVVWSMNALIQKCNPSPIEQPTMNSLGGISGV